MEKITTLEQAKELIKPIDFKTLSGKDRQEIGNFHLGAFNLDNIDKNKDTYKILEWMFKEILPPVKIAKWKDFEYLRKENRFGGFNGLRNESVVYHKFLPVGYAEKPRTPIPGHAGMDMKDTDGYVNLDTLIDWEGVERNQQSEGSLLSMYYHGAKAHWLIHSIQEEGLRAPIQGYVQKNGIHGTNTEPSYTFRIHPGSIRSGVFEEMQNNDMEIMVLDDYDVVKVEPSSLDSVLEMWYNKLKRLDKAYHCSFTYIDGCIEYNTALMDLDFRDEVHEFNKQVYDLAKGKPLTIYIGHDSRHGDLSKVSKFAILESIKQGFGRGWMHDQVKWEPEVKILDIAEIPEYTREYANQSTEFTYSRFLIPYLENYEGFSIFIDDDFIFKKSILPMFYYLNPNDAVACIKYPQYKHDETKFDGEVNIDYPKKLWSSMMVFNNGHEDCKKLTPEVVNTWTGKQLHQFEWTDNISKIPEHYIFVEGYDNHEEKYNYSGIHYTRGGPWVKGMDYTTINNLEDFLKVKRTLPEGN